MGSSFLSIKKSSPGRLCARALWLWAWGLGFWHHRKKIVSGSGAKTDSLYIDIASRPSTESQEVSEGVVLDYDAQGNLVGIDIDHASRKLNLREVITSQIPVAA